MSINILNVKIERSNIATVIAEYENRLICGVEGSKYNTLYEEYQAKLETAGKSKVISDIKKQIDEYVKK